MIVDAGDAAAIEACVKSVCATSLSEEPRDYSSEGNLYVGRAAHGKFSVGTEFSPAEVITVSVLNADGTPASKPRTFDLEWSPGPNACGWGEASTDPISL